MSPRAPPAEEGESAVVDHMKGRQVSELLPGNKEHWVGQVNKLKKNISIELENKREKDLFLKETNKNGIITRPIWDLLFKLPMYKDCQKDDQKNALALEDKIINIPSSARS